MSAIKSHYQKHTSTKNKNEAISQWGGEGGRLLWPADPEMPADSRHAGNPLEQWP